MHHAMFQICLPSLPVLIGLLCYNVYLETKRKWDYNYYLARFHPELFKRKHIKQIKQGRNKITRIHGVGEFFSQEYIDLWDDIIRECPEHYFYTYTKALDYFDFSSIESNSNFNLIDSCLEDGNNFGDKEYCERMIKEKKAKLCPCRRKDKLKCMRDCFYCKKGKKPVFLQH
jgi:hypothetical protein